MVESGHHRKGSQNFYSVVRRDISAINDTLNPLSLESRLEFCCHEVSFVTIYAWAKNNISGVSK